MALLLSITKFRIFCRVGKLSLSESHVNVIGSQVREWGRARATLLVIGRSIVCLVDCGAPRHLALYSGEDRFHLLVHEPPRSHILILYRVPQVFVAFHFESRKS